MKILLLPILFLMTCMLQAQTVLYVDASVSASGTGTSWSEAFQYLDEAFASAVEGDEIWVAEGSYIPGGATPSRTSWLSPTANFQLYGGFQGDETSRDDRNPALFEVIINGDVLGDDLPDDLITNVSDNLNHLMFLDTFITNSTVIDGITFTRGITDDGTGSGDGRRGGGILSYGSPVVENCEFIENYGWFGGGAYPRGQFAENFRIRNCQFQRNGGGFGGGMYVVGGLTLEITNCTFEDGNVTNSGAALRIQDITNFTIDECNFERNISSGSGGAINFFRANGTVKNSTFERNTGNFGGALVNYTDGVIDVDSCTFELNNSNASGAAMSLAFASTTNITNTTFAENSSSASSGAIYIQGGEAGGDTTTIVNISNSLFDLNEANSLAGAVWSRYSTEVDVNQSTFIDNICTNGGGAMVVGPDSLNFGFTEVKNSYFLFNAAGSQGGAIDVLNADLEVSNSVFNENEATTYGGAIIVNGSDTLDSSALIVNCTFNENEAEEGGFELAGFSDDSGNTTIQIQNSIFNNENVLYSTEAGSPNVASLGGNVIYTDEIDNIFTLTTDVIVADPATLFVDTRDDLALAVGSPAINVGVNNSNTPLTDITGFTRDALPDAGAFEFDPTSGVGDLSSGVGAYKIFPNPTRDVVAVSFNLETETLIGTDASIVVYDLRGTKLIEQFVRISNKQNAYSVDTNNLVGGSYIVQIVTKQGTANTSLLKL